MWKNRQTDNGGTMKAGTFSFKSGVLKLKYRGHSFTRFTFTHDIKPPVRILTLEWCS